MGQEGHPLGGLVQVVVDAQRVVVLDVHVNVLVVEHQVDALVRHSLVIRDAVAVLVELEELHWQQVSIFPFGLLFFVHPLLFLHDLVSGQHLLISFLFISVAIHHGLFLGVGHELVEGGEAQHCFLVLFGALVLFFIEEQFVLFLVLLL